MKIALCSSFVPFLHGGARNIVEWLQMMLEQEGHHVERIYLPEIHNPEIMFQQMTAYRWIDLTYADRVICFRPQAHLIRHSNKILWFIHHIRAFYDLWDTPYRYFDDNSKYRGIRDALLAIDNEALREAKHIFTNSKVVSNRLKTYNQINSEVLYPPVFQPERFHCHGHNDEIVYIARLEHHKRQHLLIEAMRYTKTPVRLRLCGTNTNQGYPDELKSLILTLKLQERVTFENRWIHEEEKIDILANCLAVAYLPLDEDSYGYPSIEASHASKAILTTTDSGGVIELINDEVNGLITEPTPKALAEAMDRLYHDRDKTKIMGKNACLRLKDLNISWAHVLKRLLA